MSWKGNSVAAEIHLRIFLAITVTMIGHLFELAKVQTSQFHFHRANYATDIPLPPIATFLSFSVSESLIFRLSKYIKIAHLVFCESFNGRHNRYSDRFLLEKRGDRSLTLHDILKIFHSHKHNRQRSQLGCVIYNLRHWICSYIGYPVYWC